MKKGLDYCFWINLYANECSERVVFGRIVDFIKAEKSTKLTLDFVEKSCAAERSITYAVNLAKNNYANAKDL